MSLERLKERLSISPDDATQDSRLTILLQDAADFFCGYCRRNAVPARAEGLIERLVVYQSSRSIGVSAESIGDTSITYDASDLPLELRRELNRYRRIGAG